MLKVTELKAKTILTRSGLPRSDWVINPYNGCAFGCSYCYAAQIAIWKHPAEDWGTYIDVKVNAPQLLKDELDKLEKKHHAKDFGSIFFSSVTDPYQGIEAKFELTKRCLETLAAFNYQGEVSILTKSPLVTRDIPILQKLSRVSVGLTVTSLSDEISRVFEANAPAVSTRITALRKLHNEGIKTYAFIGPLFPHLMDKEKEINLLLDALEEVGIKEVWFELLNLKPAIRKRLFSYLKSKAPQLLPIFEKASTDSYQQSLEKIILGSLKGRKMILGGGTIFRH